MSHKTVHNRTADRGMSGFSLVELMVASVILGMTVSAVAFMIINSDVLWTGNDHNRQARIIAQEELEDPQHHFFRYFGMAELHQSINLDPGEARSTLAMRNLTVSDPPLVFSITDAIGTTVLVPYRKVASEVTWQDEGVGKSVTLSKRIVLVR